MCGTVQSMDTLIAVGAGSDEESVEGYVGFSCVGRWTGAGSPRKEPDGRPCNWTLGGLLQIRELEVVTDDGEVHHRFEIATPAEAKTLMEEGCAWLPRYRVEFFNRWASKWQEWEMEPVLMPVAQSLVAERTQIDGTIERRIVPA
jgi:hypothetical protein